MVYGFPHVYNIRIVDIDGHPIHPDSDWYFYTTRNYRVYWMVNGVEYNSGDINPRSGFLRVGRRGGRPRPPRPGQGT